MSHTWKLWERPAHVFLMVHQDLGSIKIRVNRSAIKVSTLFQVKANANTGIEEIRPRPLDLQQRPKGSWLNPSKASSPASTSCWNIATINEFAGQLKCTLIAWSKNPDGLNLGIHIFVYVYKGHVCIYMLGGGMRSSTNCFSFNIFLLLKKKSKRCERKPPIISNLSETPCKQKRLFKYLHQCWPTKWGATQAWEKNCTEIEK